MIRRVIQIGVMSAALLFGGAVGGGVQPLHALSAGVLAKLDIQGFDELVASWKGAMLERGQMFDALKMMEKQYEAQVAEIEALKRRGVDNLRRPELEKKLSQARALATQLDQLQRELAARDAQITQLATQIVELLDARRIELEQQLVGQGPSPGLVKTLNELSAERATYARPLPRQDRRRYADMLDDAHRVQDPEDMLAMADELQDAEVEVRRRLSEVEGRLDDLKTRRKLLQRANAFSREERFFEEGDRGRTFSSRVRASNDGATQQPSNPTNQPPRGETVASDDAQVPAQPNAEPSNMPDAPQAGAGENVDPDTNFATDSGDPEASRDGGGVNDPGLSDSPGSVHVPSQGGSGTGGGTTDPFGAPRDVIVLNRQADPNVSTRATDVPAAEIDGRIKRLESEQKQLERQAKELKRRAAQLRKQAEQAE